MTEFNFDEWAELYKTSPEEFENKRREFLEAEIMKAPIEHRNKLLALQLECDIISLTNTTLNDTIEFSKMMKNKLDSIEIPLTELRDIVKDLDK